jgi:hypothetical protein
MARVAAGRREPASKPAVTTPSRATNRARLAARRRAWSASGAARPTVAGMACTQLRRSCSPRRGVIGSGTKPVRPHGRGRFEAWRRARHAVGEGLERGRKAQMGRLLLSGVVGVILANGAFAAPNEHAFARASALEPRSLLRAESIRRQLDTRYRVCAAADSLSPKRPRPASSSRSRY